MKEYIYIYIYKIYICIYIYTYIYIFFYSIFQVRKIQTRRTELTQLGNGSIGVRTRSFALESMLLTISSTSLFLFILSHTPFSHLDNEPPKQSVYSIRLIIVQFYLGTVLATPVIPYFYIVIDSNQETTCCFKTMSIKLV
jgi:hypothetical protein